MQGGAVGTGVPARDKEETNGLGVDVGKGDVERGVVAVARISRRQAGKKELRDVEENREGEGRSCHPAKREGPARQVPNGSALPVNKQKSCGVSVRWSIY